MLHRALHRITEMSLANWILAAAMVALAIEPVVWLVETWFDPVYDSAGLWVFAAVVGLGVWSFTSRLTEGQEAVSKFDKLACTLLVGTALLRLSGHLIAIHVLAAFSLVLDVWAIGRLLQLHRRERAVSPFWLSILFAFSLPIERIVQRLIGFPLQMISAEGACGVLKVGFADVVCNGVDLQVAGAEVLVDLPCSGARGLMLLAIAFAALCAVHRPGLVQAVFGTVLALASAYVSNVLRISALSAGVALGPEVLGFDVMMQPWHDIVGWVALGFGVTPLLLWARKVGGLEEGGEASLRPRCGRSPLGGDSTSLRSDRVLVSTLVRDRYPVGAAEPPSREEGSTQGVPEGLRSGIAFADGDVGAPAPIATLTSGAPAPIATPTSGAPAPIATLTSGAPAPIATLTSGAPALIAVLAVAALFLSTSEPVDVSKPVETVELPRMMLGHLSDEDELSDHEKDFFTRYGGAARRAAYGSSTLLVVRTTSPLRHIHAPDECLRGLGYEVDRLGVRHDDLPHALYRAVDRNGRVWRVAVTYVSSNNEIATSVAEAVWMWLRDPTTTWTVYERLQPWSAESDHQHFDDTILRFYELPIRR